MAVGEGGPGERDPAGSAPPGQVLHRRVGVVEVEESGNDLDQTASGGSDDVEERVDLGVVGGAGGHGTAVRVDVEL